MLTSKLFSGAPPRITVVKILGGMHRVPQLAIGEGGLTHIATGTVIVTSVARDIRGEARRERNMQYLIRKGIALHLPHPFPPHRQTEHGRLPCRAG
jgi:hypothetical protein